MGTDTDNYLRSIADSLNILAINDAKRMAAMEEQKVEWDRANAERQARFEAEAPLREALADIPVEDPIAKALALQEKFLRDMRPDLFDDEG